MIIFFIVASLANIVFGYILYKEITTQLHIYKVTFGSTRGGIRFTRFLIVTAVLSQTIYFLASHYDLGIVALLASITMAIFYLALFSFIPYWLVRLLFMPLKPFIYMPEGRILILEGIFVLLTTLYIGFGLVGGMRDPGLVKIDLSIDNFPIDNFKIVQLSDMHIGPVHKNEFVSTIVERVNKLKPDLVAITGDLIDNNSGNLQDDLGSLSKLQSRFGNFFVTGNHEYYHTELSSLLTILEDLGVKSLINSGVTIAADQMGGFNLIGLTDKAAERVDEAVPDFSLATANRDLQLPTILLAHRPEAIKMIDNKVDLVLSGHTHGGQIFPFGLLTKLANPYLYGLHRHNEFTQIYVSRGTGFWGPIARFWAPNEITLITIKSATKGNLDNLSLPADK